MSTYYNNYPPQKINCLSSLVSFNYYLWRNLRGLYYITKKLENRRARINYWQEQANQQADRLVTLIEGWNSQQIANKLADSQLNFSADDFLQISGYPKKNYQSLPVNKWPQDFSDRYEFLQDKPKYLGLEGYLFADTYRFHPSSSPEEVIIKLLNNFDRQLNTKCVKILNAKARQFTRLLPWLLY